MNDKAARLAAIRAANAAQKTTETAEVAPKAPPPPQAIEKQPTADLDETMALAWPNALLVLSAVIFGALLAVWAMPLILPGLAGSMQGEQPHVYWYLARSSGLVAYGLLWISMVMGLLISGKGASFWPGPSMAMGIHQHTGLLGLAFGLFHALILLGDDYIGFGIAAIFIPFQSEYQPFWVACGQLAWYGMLIVHGSFYLRPLIGRTAWRRIHYLSFGVFLLSLGHGILSGSDSINVAVRWFYWGSGGSVIFLLLYRILATRKPSKPGATAKQGA